MARWFGRCCRKALLRAYQTNSREKPGHREYKGTHAVAAASQRPSSASPTLASAHNDHRRGPRPLAGSRPCQRIRPRDEKTSAHGNSWGRRRQRRAPLRPPPCAHPVLLRTPRIHQYDGTHIALLRANLATSRVFDPKKCVPTPSLSWHAHRYAAAVLCAPAHTEQSAVPCTTVVKRGRFSCAVRRQACAGRTTGRKVREERRKKGSGRKMSGTDQ